MGLRGPRRYRLLGGLLAWRVPLLVAILAFAGLRVGEWLATGGLLIIGLALWELDRSLVVEISPHGLARGFALPGGALTAADVVRWRGVDAVETRWLRPNDFSVLETVVSAGDGSIRFTSRMGLRAYRRVLREVERRAPHARRIGLTDELLREAPARRRRRWPVLALVEIVLVVAGLLALSI